MAKVTTYMGLAEAIQTLPNTLPRETDEDGNAHPVPLRKFVLHHLSTYGIDLRREMRIAHLQKIGVSERTIKQEMLEWDKSNEMVER